MKIVYNCPEEEKQEINELWLPLREGGGENHFLAKLGGRRKMKEEKKLMLIVY